jgi:hypothetical protein
MERFQTLEANIETNEERRRTNIGGGAAGAVISNI